MVRSPLVTACAINAFSGSTFQPSAQAPIPVPRSHPIIEWLAQGKLAFSIWADDIGVGKD
jgi:hypothetical protein